MATSLFMKETLRQNQNLKWIDCSRTRTQVVNKLDKHGIDLKHDLFVVEAQLMSDIQIWAKMQHRQGLGQELALHLWAQLELHKYSEVCALSPHLSCMAQLQLRDVNEQDLASVMITRLQTFEVQSSLGQPSPSCPWGAKRCPTWQRLWFEPWLHPSDQRDDPAEND